ncbi:hypothetical protein AG1IA_05899 [Rhizoctonia solani AG-1 IA]|uniref:Uncharacterized protein n=1 Tax=Thanatephorus cucumeris (strain AG1-IA) TaxID=983506 RepID=L8WPI1_THACA|nr:hypothetical protein AG1IA_05899 [Rhizoctonia solani AG-1 IA]
MNIAHLATLLEKNSPFALTAYRLTCLFHPRFIVRKFRCADTNPCRLFVGLLSLLPVIEVYISTFFDVSLNIPQCSFQETISTTPTLPTCPRNLYNRNG